MGNFISKLTITSLIFGYAAIAHANPVSCLSTGGGLAQCAAAWEHIFKNNNMLEDTGSAFEAGYFEGFVHGAATATIQKAWCTTKPFSTDQLVAIVAKYIRENPEKWQESNDRLVIAPLTKAFPCNKTTKRQTAKQADYR